jgi:mannose-6-phosphate isomerase-like protein (cupin superfamily)
MLSERGESTHGNLIVYPDSFYIKEKLEQSRLPRLVASFSEELLTGFIGGGEDFEIIEVDFQERHLFVACHDFHFYPGQESKKSPGSQSIYYGRSKDKMDGLLLQYLPPNSRTSRHYHRLKTEIYHGIEGEAIIIVGEERNKLKLRKNKLEIFPGTVHQVITEDSPALTLLKIMGDPKGLSLDDHIYVE